MERRGKWELCKVIQGFDMDLFTIIITIITITTIITLKQKGEMGQGV